MTGESSGNSSSTVGQIPLVSVGLPTYNRAPSLKRAIESVLSQDYLNIELIISDNASSDQTERECGRYAARDERVRYIRQDYNIGAEANFRAVLRLAVGHYFMWIGDDDWLGSSYLSRCVDVINGRSDVSLVCGVPTYVDEGILSVEGVRISLEQESPSARVLEFYNKVNDNGTFYGVMRRIAIQQNYPPSVLAADWLLIGYMAFLGKILTLDDIAVYRSSRGVSADVRSLAIRYGTAERDAREPHRSIAAIVARDIARDSHTFKTLNVVARWILAEKCALAVHRRFVPKQDPITAVTQWGRALLKRHLHFT